jgi:hypothetical protein
MTARHCFHAVVALSFVVIAGGSAQAHHSFNDIFDVTTVTTLKGVLSKIDWINPHVYMNIDVKDSAGKVTTWAVECPPTNHLRTAGITRGDLWNNASGGEIVTIHVNPAKNAAKAATPTGLLMRITYADGHFFHVRGDLKALDAQ